MTLTKGAILLFVCLGYGMVSMYTVYIAKTDLKKSNNQDLHAGSENITDQKIPHKPGLSHSSKQPEHQNVVIWDTCGLGVYLWHNILHGKITRYNLFNGWTHDSLEIGGLSLQFSNCGQMLEPSIPVTIHFIPRYHLGYGMLPDRALPVSSPNVVLIINSRSAVLVEKSRAWLDLMLKSAYIHQIAIMMLGRESCDNEWILPYLHQSRIKCLFLVYDSPLVDDDLVYQWPLGVALHRNSSNYGDEFLDLTAPRKYVFNFVGTVYESGSRVDMMEAIKTLGSDVKYFTKTRSKWTDQDTSEEMAVHRQSLRESDITLSPMGRNSECYRIYEALEMGSIPIVEDVLAAGTCGNFEGGEPANFNVTPPHRLLKRYNAPVIFVRDWRLELPGTVKKFREMSHREKLRLRLDLTRWYVEFKESMKNRFLSVIRDKFGLN